MEIACGCYWWATVRFMFWVKRRIMIRVRVSVRVRVARPIVLRPGINIRILPVACQFIILDIK